MKKMVMVGMLGVILAFGMAVSAHAQSGLFFGGRLGLGGIFNNYDDEISGAMPTESGASFVIIPENLLAFALHGYAGYGITDKLAVTGGVMLALNEGWKLRGAEHSTTILDIPVLLRYTFLEKPLILGIQGGPHLGIPLGSKMSGNGVSLDLDTEGVVFGASAGLYAGYPLGPGRIMGDIRLLGDFNPVKNKVNGFGTINSLYRMNLLFMLGYEISIGKK